MGRRMRPLDPQAGPVERFASELRALRALAGDQPFWKMARRCGVSKSALAAAAAGWELPSQNVTREFVRACAGDWSWWRERWLQASTELTAAADVDVGDVGDVPDVGDVGDVGNVDAGDVDAGERGEPAAEGPGGGVLAVPHGKVLSVLRRQAAQTAPDGRPHLPVPPPAAVRFGGPPRPHRLGWGLAAALVVVAAVVAAVIMVPVRTDNRPAPGGPSRSPSRTAMIIDGTDPQAVGCGADRTALQSRPVLLEQDARLRGRRLPKGTRVGVISLVYSPRCAGAWARFDPTPGLNPDPDDSTVGTTTIEADRLADNTRTLWRMGHIDSSYSGILLTGLGCVVAQARVDMVGQNAAATGRTDCLPHLA